MICYGIDTGIFDRFGGGEIGVDRRKFLGYSALGASSAIFHGCTQNELSDNVVSPPDDPSNVIVILADDMRWDALRLAGNRIIHTPHLDALTQDGVLFVNNFVTTSICPTSRVSILTGQYARRHGIWDFSTPLSEQQWRISYPGILSQWGYQTAYIGKWGIGGPLPESKFDYWRGFEGQGYYFDPTNNRQEHLTAFLGRQAIEFLETKASSQPFCLTLGFKAPHVQDGDPDPFKPDPKFSALYQQVTIPRPPTASEAHFQKLPDFLQTSEGRSRWQNRFASDEQYQYSVKQYYRLITGLDAAVGALVDALKSKNLYHNTHIFFTSDNGFFLGEHGLAGKWWGYEESIRTPLIFKPAGERVTGIVSSMTLNIDIYPTLMDLLGIEVPDHSQGKSLLPLITKMDYEFRDSWFYEHLFEHPAIAKSEGIRTEKYKYLQYLNEDNNGEFLFDLYNDPYEETNLIENPEYQTILQEIKQDLVRNKQQLA